MSRRKTSTTPDPTGSATWEAIGSSVRGASHDRTGLPNQDAHAIRAVGGEPAGAIVAAVADGHGGQRYVRSQVGSHLAVAIATAGAAELVSRLGSDVAAETLERALLGELAPTIVQQWRAAVFAHLAEHPFAPEEHATGGADLDLDPPISYGATLILAVMVPGTIGLLQIGDGDALVVSTDGSVVDPVPGDDRLVGGETTSLCLPDAASDARAATLPADGRELVVLASDGYGNSFASPTWREESGAGFLDAVRRDGLAGVEARLPDWLADSAAAGGDDVTVVVARRSGSSRSPVVTPPVTAPVAAPDTPAPAETSAPGRGGTKRGPLLVGIAVAALLLGALGGWVLGRSDDGSAAESASTTATTTTGLEGATGGGGAAPTSTTVTTGQGPGAGAVLPTGTAESILGEDMVVTFSPVVEDGRVYPTVTLTGPTDPTERVVVGYVTYEVVDGDVRFGTRTVEVAAQAVAIRIIDRVVWVADVDGRVRPYDLNGEPLLDWQPLEERESE